MQNWRVVLSALEDCTRPSDRLLVIHSSISRLRPPGSAGKWTFLRALRALLDQGRTLALPTFTFGFCRGQPFHFRDSPSETGMLGEWLLSLDGARRTRHPIYSFAVAGPAAGEIEDCVNTTTFGDDSVFAAFERLDARLVMLGCEWSYCTQFHRYEEEAGVPYRLYKTFTGEANFGDGGAGLGAKMFVRDLEINATNDFTVALTQLQSEGRIMKAPLWGAMLQSVACRDLARTSRELLKADPWALVRDSTIAAHRLSQRRRAEREPPLRIAVLGSSNLQLIANGLREEVAGLIDDRRLEFFMPPYGQMNQEILSPSSELSRFQADLTFFVDRIEDLTGVAGPELVDAQAAEARNKQYAEAIRSYRETNRGWIVVNRFAILGPPVLGAADAQAPAGAGALLGRLDRQLSEAVEGLADVHLFDLQQAAGRFADGPVVDPRLWYLGRFPFSDRFSRYLGRRYAALVIASLGRATRLIVLDLDNTLWGGILGEDGIGGLQLGGDYPGNAFAGFQKMLKGLAERGIALAICSKNNEDQALEAIARLPGMVLKPDDFAAHRINWGPKWKNLCEICEELNLGFDHVLFVDDDPIQREHMRHYLPAVKVLDLPRDPTRYTAALLESPWLECLALTEEDRKRTRSYRTRRRLEAARAAYGDDESFCASLGTRLHLTPLNEGNTARAIQLLDKTNQFNATTHRYNRRQLETLAREDADVIVIGVEDKFSEFENVGVLIVHWNHPAPRQASVNSYLLSCRVLGRGIETGVLYWLMDAARARGMAVIFGRIVETERNAPVRSVYKDAGFTHSGGPADWHMDLVSHTTSLPSWLTVVDRTVERKVA